MSRLLEIPIPGNVLGMGLLLVAFSMNLVDVKWLEEAADLLLSNMALFFVPAGVGMMMHFDRIINEWLPISIALILSTVVTMAATAAIMLTSRCLLAKTVKKND